LTSDHLSYRMLDLKTCVHLHKVELISDSVKNELNSTSIYITNSSCSLDSSLSNLFSNILANLWWCLFNYLLMSSLHWAISFIQVDIITVTITEYLQFNVTWLLDILFNDHMLITKALQCLTLSCIELIEELLLMSNDSHTLATTSERGLDDNGEPNLFGLIQKELRILVVSMITWDNRHIGISHDKLRLRFATHSMNRLCRGADKDLQNRLVR